MDAHLGRCAAARDGGPRAARVRRAGANYGGGRRPGRRRGPSETRRARALWLREVGRDMREGRTTRALDTLLSRGKIGEHETREAAMKPLVERYAEDVRAERARC